nr:MAG TPA: tail protein [Caudoviricetes sp.]
MIELHLDKRVAISPTPITLRVGDQSIQHEEFVLYQNGEYYAIPENAKVMFEGNLYNGQLTSGECEILDRSKGKVKYTFSSGNASVEGAYKRAYLRVYKSDIELVSSENIRIIVLENADLDNGTAEAYENRLEKKLDEFDDKLLEVDSAVTTAKTDIAAKVEDVSIVGESAKTNITKWATETQSIAQTEQAKIQAELPAVQVQLDQALTELNQLKNGMRWYNAYKMADGTFTKVKPADNLFKHSDVTSLAFAGTSDSGTIMTGSSLYVGYCIPVVSGETYSIQRDSIGNNRFRVGFTSVYPVLDTPYFGGLGSSTDSALKIEGLLVPQNATYLIIYLSNQGDKIGKLKIEKSNKTTIYTPSPLEDPLNAYPKEKGIGLLDSTNETDYSWDYTKEFVDYALGLKADKTELNALADRVSILE